MEFNPISLLIKEHEVISIAKDTIEELPKFLENDPEKYRQTVEQLLFFFREYSDNFHHHKEEAILFPEVVGNNFFIQGEIIRELEEQHELLRNQINSIEALFKANQYSEVNAQFHDFMETLLDHIAIENDEVFPMIEDLLDDYVLEKIYHRCIDFDQEQGPQTKENLENTIRNIVKARI